MFNTFQSFLEGRVAPLLQAFFDPFHALLNALPPAAWRASICLYLAAGVLWAVFLKRAYIYQGAPDAQGWRDLRLWLPFLLLPYLAAYLIF